MVYLLASVVERYDEHIHLNQPARSPMKNKTNLWAVVPTVEFTGPLLKFGSIAGADYGRNKCQRSHFRNLSASQ